MILHFLSEPLREMPMALLERVCRSMQLVQYDQHSVVYSKGDDPAFYYVVLSGAPFCLLLCCPLWCALLPFILQRKDTIMEHQHMYRAMGHQPHCVLQQTPTTLCAGRFEDILLSAGEAYRLLAPTPVVLLHQTQGHETPTSTTLCAGRFEDILLSAGEAYRPLAPKRLIAAYKKGHCFGGTHLIQGQARQSTVVSSGLGTVCAVPKREYLVRPPCCGATLHPLTF